MKKAKGCLVESIVGISLVACLILVIMLFNTPPGGDIVNPLNVPTVEIDAFISGGTKEVAICAPLLPFVAIVIGLFAFYMKGTSDSRHED